MDQPIRVDSKARNIRADGRRPIWQSLLARRATSAGPHGQNQLPKSWIGHEPWFTPPFGSRYALLFQKNAQGDADKSLYITLETAQNKSLQLIGTASDDATFEEIQSWEAFFNPVITAWMTDNSLPHHDCGNWQYMHEPSRAAAVAKGRAKQPRSRDQISRHLMAPKL